MNITNKKDIKIGMLVDIQTDEDKGTDYLTRGYVADILSQANHAKGIKVKLQGGAIGRIQHIPSKEEIRQENFKFYNKFFFHKQLYTVYDEVNRKFYIHEHHNQASGKLERTAMLFETESDARAFFNGTIYGSKNYPIRPIHRRKPIIELFSDLRVDYFRINGDRKLSAEKMKEWEEYFKNMR